MLARWPEERIQLRWICCAVARRPEPQAMFSPSAQELARLV